MIQYAATALSRGALSFPVLARSTQNGGEQDYATNANGFNRKACGNRALRTARATTNINGTMSSELTPRSKSPEARIPNKEFRVQSQF